MNQLRQLLDTYEEMLAAATRVDDKEKMALCHNYIGATLRLMGRWKDSYSCQLKGLEIARSLSNPLPLAVGLSNLGALCTEMANYDEALEYLNESLRISKETNNRLRIASADGTIGKILLAKGKWEDAIDKFKETLIHGEFLNDPRHQMCSNISLALTECARGNFSEVEQYLENAKKFASEIKESMDEPDGARTLPDGSFSLEERLKRKRDLFVLTLTEAYFERCRQRNDVAADKAEEALEVAINIGYLYGEIRALQEKSLCLYRAQERSQALKIAEESIKKAQDLGATQLQAEGHRICGVLQAASSRFDEARTNFQKGVSLFSTVGDVHGLGRIYIDFGVCLLRNGLESEPPINMLRGLQTLISLDKVSEPIDVIEEYNGALQEARKHLEEHTSNALERIIGLGNQFQTAKTENEIVSTLDVTLLLRKEILYLATLTRILGQCARLVIQLTPKEIELQNTIHKTSQSLDNLLNVLRDQEQVILSHVDLIRRRVDEFERDREQQRTVLLQLMQSVLASLGATAIYLSILLKVVATINFMDLIAVALTILVWAMIPVCAYMFRLKTGKVWFRRTLLVLVISGGLFTIVHLVRVVRAEKETLPAVNQGPIHESR